MNPLHDYALLQTRRQFFRSSGLSMGALALNQLLGARAQAAAAPAYGSAVHPALPGFPHFPPKAKRIIYLHMNGAPSQIDLFDYKPKLSEYFDKELPDSIRNGQRITTMTSGQARFPVAPSIFKFAQHGQSGMWLSELIPNIASIADDIALVKTVSTEAINHDPACTFLMTGNELPGKPSLGSWLSYGLGSENEDLPSFVVLTPSWSAKANAQALFTRMWQSGFLPTRFSGVALRSQGDPVLYIKNPPGVDRDDRRGMLDALNTLNQGSFARFGDPETQTRISQYEMAFRMQSSVPELVDIAGETQETLDLYGPDVKKPGTFAASALLARRLVERGVRVVQILHRGWDQHGSLPSDLKLQCNDVDQASAALIKDLKQRGLLDDTLVVWGGEFGRTVYSQGTLTQTNYGRDHHPRNFCMWMAGGGVKGGVVHGETDDFSYNVVENPVHLRDLNATILHCMGIDHAKLTYKFQGLEQKLTGVLPAKAVSALLS
ncbi:MAG TPA: DUF1501 domain-containing protein [Chthoniobacteraceae bacterium]|jgi:hypothetical protein|nr:DUF1501 domain-containing protein [Chthoniobacteraceae bacterium]